MHAPFRARLPLMAAIITIALQACAAAQAPAPAPPPADSPAQRIVAAARADAARRTGIAEAGVRVLAVESVTWRDGSLGCPRPGIAATQALVPGWRIRLQAGEQHWNYHASERGGLVACPPERAQDPLPSGRD